MGNCAEFHLGDIVYSMSGRDMGRYYVVMYIDGGFAGICDGDLHKTDKVKRKNVKHLKHSGSFCEYVRRKLEGGEKVTNAELRRSIGEFCESEKEGN